MSELDKSIEDVQSEIASQDKPKRKSTSSLKRGKSSKFSLNIPLLLVIGLAIVLVFQLKTLTSWVFGVPEETVQADIIALLKTTDEKLQNIEASSGSYPNQLPADTPTWLVGYKKTLAGYKINTQIDGVHMVLERNGSEISINRQE